MSVEQKAEAEAHKKGLDEEETERYVGGTFNAIRRRRGYGSPHNRRVDRKQEEREAFQHKKKYGTSDDTRMMHRIKDGYTALSMKGRSKAAAHFRQQGWTTDYTKMSRRQMEKMVDYLESLNEQPGMKRE